MHSRFSLNEVKEHRYINNSKADKGHKKCDEGRVMAEILTFCGFRCDLCPAYSKNKNTLASQQETSEGWKKYLNLDLLPGDILCDGCRNIGKHVDSDCPIRPCILQKKLETCADCETMNTCEDLKTRADGIDPFKKKFEGKISEKDYALFIEPYEGRKRLLALKKKK